MAHGKIKSIRTEKDYRAALARIGSQNPGDAMLMFSRSRRPARSL